MEEVDVLYHQYLRENPDSKLSVVSFRQIWMLRQAELKSKPRAIDAAVDDKVMFRSEQQHSAKTKEDNIRVEKLCSENKRKNDRILAKLLAQLHQSVGVSCRDNLKMLCKSAMHPTSPTLSMQDFANKVIDICRDDVIDEENSLEIEVGLREVFANLLAVPVDSFGSGKGSESIHAVSFSLIDLIGIGQVECLAEYLPT